MFDIIKSINARGVAVLLVEQNVGQALEIASCAYVIEQGRIVTSGAPATLRAQPEIRAAYLGIT
jgi:branched-chain amino acid transport system ATP-binding protein